MQPTHKKKSTLFISIAVVVAVIIIGGILYWSTHKKSIIKDKVTSAITKKSNGLYNIEYSNLQLDEVTGYLSISDIKLTYDSLKLQALIKENKAPAVIFTITADSIVANGVKTPKALIDKEIVGNKLLLVHPNIQIIYTQQGKDSAKNVPDKEVYREILGNLNLIKVDSIEIRDGSFATKKLGNKKDELSIARFSIGLSNVLIDSASSKDASRILFAKNISLNADTIRWKSKDKLYNFQLDSFYLNSSDKAAFVKQFLFEPVYTETEFMQNTPVQKDRFNFTINNIKINGLQVHELLNEAFMAESATTNGSSFKIYHDLNLPPDGKIKIGGYPQQALMKIKLPLNIKKIKLNNSFVEYKERNAITKMSGKVQFYNIDASINNFTNMPALIKKDNKLVVDIKTDFLNVAPFSVKWVMYLMNPNGKFAIDGNMQGFNGTALNQIIEPMGPARVEAGDIKNLSFNLVGTNYTMTGKLALQYKNLKVALLKKDADEAELKKKGLASALSNLFIKNANPQKGKELRTSTINFTRDTKRSIFSFIWKSIFTGLKENVGIKK